MPYKSPPVSVSKEDLDIWSRVVAKRRKQCAALTTRQMLSIVQGESSEASERSPSPLPTAIDDPFRKLECALNHHFYRSADKNAVPSRRRSSWDTVQKMLDRVDRAVARLSNRESSPLNRRLSIEQAPSICYTLSNPSTGDPLRSSPLNEDARTRGNCALETSTGQTQESSSLSYGNSISQTQFGSYRSKMETSTRPNLASSQRASETSTRPNLASSHRASETSSSQTLQSSSRLEKTSTDTNGKLLGLDQSKSTSTGGTPGAVPVTLPAPANLQPPGLVPSLPKQSAHAIITNTPLQLSAQGEPRSPPIRTATSAATNSSTSSLPPKKPESFRPVQVAAHQRTATQQRDSTRGTNSSSSTSQRLSTVASDRSRPSTAAKSVSASVSPAPIGSTAKYKVSSNGMGLKLSTAAQVAVTQTEVPPTVTAANGKGLASTIELTEARAVKSIAQNSNATDAVAELPASTKPARLPVTLWFDADNGMPKFSAALEGRKRLRVTYIPVPMATSEKERTKDRLDRWDPYWQMEHIVSTTETFKIEKYESLASANPPVRVAECGLNLKDTRDAAGLISDWGKPRPQRRYEQGEVRLLLRMLPLVLTKEKKPRGDTHLWPKGTFLQINGRPVHIVQRKQQSHDPKEWKYMSHALDMTSIITHPMSWNKIQLCCLDDQPYVFCLAICRYRSPETLYDVVLKEWVEKLSHAEAVKKALKMANQQTVVLEDADTCDQVNSFIFPLTCPISQTLLVTPVRGKNCAHWQCFDLSNFLQSNAHVSGIRWECPVCMQLLSCRDLQLCGFTQSLLTQFEDEARPHRDRIQFFSDGTWKLLDEAKKRYAKKRSSQENEGGVSKKMVLEGGTSQSRFVHEVIDLL